MHAGLALLGILAYSLIPMLVCHKFDHYDRVQRMLMAFALVFVTLVVELAFMAVAFALTVGLPGLDPYARTLAVASVVQCALMGLGFYLLESIRDNGAMRKRLESLVRFNPNGIAMIDGAAHYVMVNPAYEAITGYAASELIGREWRLVDYTGAPDRDVLDQLLEGKVVRDVPFTLRHKLGHPVEVRRTVVPVVEEDHTVGFLALVVDRTEAEQADAALMRVQRLSELGQLAAGIVHDVRSPLQAIMGLLELMPVEPGAEEFTRMMQDEGARINLLLSQLLALGKPPGAARAARDLRLELQDVLRLLSRDIANQGLTVSTRLADQPVMVECEPDQLKQALLNIVQNAVEASEPGGNLEVAVGYERAGVVCVEVVDHGPGIDPALIGRVGEPFLTTKDTGTGLGLMMTKRIIEHHQGRLDISSAPGVGTTVAILLPAAAVASMQQPAG